MARPRFGFFVLLLSAALPIASQAEEFDSSPAWPLCARITEAPPAGWVEADGCPSERWGNSNFTYVEVGDTLLGVSSPELQDDDINDPIMIEPMVQVWSRTWVTRRLYTPKEPIAVEQTKIPGKDGTWQQRVQEGSAIKGRLLVSDGSLAAGLSGGNPRDIRLRKLGLLKIGESATDPALPPQGDTVSSYDDFRRYYEAKTGIKSEFIGLTREQKNVLAKQRRQAWLDSKSPSERQELDSLSQASTLDANDMDSDTSTGGESVTDKENSNGD